MVKLIGVKGQCRVYSSHPIQGGWVFHISDKKEELAHMYSWDDFDKMATDIGGLVVDTNDDVQFTMSDHLLW